MKSMKQKNGYPDFILNNKELNERYEGVCVKYFLNISLKETNKIPSQSQGQLKNYRII